MFTTRYICTKCQTITQVISDTNDFSTTMTGYCGHDMQEAN